jgi:hypothetical protein
VQACGDREGRRRHGGGGPLRFTHAPRLQHRLRHLLDKQRDAVSALDNVLPDVRWKKLVTDDPVDHCADVAFCQSINRESGDVRASKPRWIELWSERHEKQHRKGAYPVNYPTKHFQARRVAPMDILEDHQHRTAVCQRLNL